MRSLLHAAAVAAALLGGSAVLRGQPQPDPNRPVQPQRFRFELMGPASGGRIASISGVPGDTSTWYLGSASGGVWKSTDGGASFRPIFDDQPVQAIGALAVTPSNPRIVWAGTGEAWAIRDADVMGDGIYKSTDAGATWKNVGLRETGRIGRIIVHPTNPNIVFACTLGRATGPQQERGVYRTTDGGATWTRVLFVDENTGCSGLTLDAKNPTVLFAGMWQVVMHTYAMYSGGPSSGVYASRDGGATWTKVAHPGLPKSPVGKIDVAVAPSSSQRVYALIQTADQGSLWRSDDGGRAWRVVSWARPLIGRAGYYVRVAVSPSNPDEVLVANSSFWRSLDGGKTFREERWGGDNHDIWIDPTNADHFGLTNDADARLTTNHGRTFRNTPIANGQMYHVAVDNRVPYWLYSNRQDNGTMRGPSDAPEQGLGGGGRGGRGGGGGRGAAPAAPAPGRGLAGRGGADSAAAARAGAPARPPAADTAAAPPPDDFGGGGSTWDHGIGGCESGFTLPDLTDTNIVWATCYGNTVTRYDHRARLARSVSPGTHTLDSPPNKIPYRCHWTPPLALDPFDQKTVYYGCQVIFKTSNAGQSWTVISPDLSTRDSSRVVSSGGVVEDNLGQFYGEVVFAIAPSEVQRGLIWAGTNDGQLWNTVDGGATWTNVSKNIAGLPTWGTIRKIEPSHFDANTAYIAVDMHMMDDRKPYLFKTTDLGKTWTTVTGDLPADHPLSYTMAIAEHPNRRGMLFAGTGHGFYYSLDDGRHWTQFKDGLPAAPVTWIVTPKDWRDVVVSTYGRGLFILRDVAALEAAPSTAAAELFPPHQGYRQARSGRADLTFRLTSGGPVRVEILDSAGALVRTMPVAGRAGINRVQWNLRYDAAPQVALRTAAPDNPHIFDEPRFNGRDTRPIIHWGIQGPQTQGPIAAPGRYTVRLAAAGMTLTQPLTIVRDPAIVSPDADLIASTQMQVRIRDDMKTTVDMINRLEVLRKQLADQVTANAGRADVLRSLDEMEKKLLDVELRLLSRSDLQSDDKYYVEPYKVYLNLIWLLGEVGTGAGDVAGGADYRPTDASRRTLETIERDLEAAAAAFKALMENDVPAFNRAMEGRGRIASR
jgi:photosystem II stability/assembly factor-like uncharacterized protein